MTYTDPTDFAVALVEGKRIDVRRMIFAMEDAQLLRDTLDLIEEQDGDEMLRSWLGLRLRVVELMTHAERVQAGAAAPMERRQGRFQPRRPPPAVQTTFLAPPAAPAPEPVDLLDVTGTPDHGALVFLSATDLDDGTLPEPEPVVLVEPAPLVDPRPAIPLRVPVRREPPPFIAACLDTLPGVLWLLRQGRTDGGARVHRRDLAALARDQAHATPARWALARWHRTAWADGSACETMAAALGLRVTWEHGLLTLSDADAATGPPLSAPAGAS